MQVHPGVFVCCTSTQEWRPDPEIGGGTEEHVLFDIVALRAGLTRFASDADRQPPPGCCRRRRSLLVLEGGARIVFEDGPTLDLGPGDMASLPKGAVTGGISRSRSGVSVLPSAIRQRRACLLPVGSTCNASTTAEGPLALVLAMTQASFVAARRAGSERRWPRLRSEQRRRVRSPDRTRTRRGRDDSCFRPTIHPGKEGEFESFLRETAVPLVSQQSGIVASMWTGRVTRPVRRSVGHGRGRRRSVPSQVNSGRRPWSPRTRNTSSRAPGSSIIIRPRSPESDWRDA